MKKHAEWTRDQLLIALHLYMVLPFGRLHQRNPEIVDLAGRIGRTPSALAMKACNFASLDPAFTATKRKGLSGASENDRAIWNEFNVNPEKIAAESEETLASVSQFPEDGVLPLPQAPTGDTDVHRWVRTRRVQSFFRAAVLVSYSERCAITGLAIPELLIASHIIPWSESIERRADPTNGICLNALFDRAFDRGLITVDQELRVVVSEKLRIAASRAELDGSLQDAHGRQLRLPQRFPPDSEALAYHRKHVYVG